MGFQRIVGKATARRPLHGSVVGLVVCSLLLAGGTACAQTTERVSVASNGTEGNGTSGFPSIDGTGRYVAFQSEASNLVAGDTNEYHDIFLHDRQTATTTRVSVASDGSESTMGIEGSRAPVISRDGRYVAFYSDAPDLVAGDTNGFDDIFVHDRQTGATERVSVASDGGESDGPSYDASLSVDGRYVAFASWASNLVPGDVGGYDDIFVHDRQTGTTERVSVAGDGSESNGPSYWPSISGDGRYVAFTSAASNLVPGDTGGHDDVFVHDRETGATERVSVASDGSQGDDFSYAPQISSNGGCVAFGSAASNLVPGDTNGHSDIFVRDRQSGTTERVSVASDGSEGDEASYYAAISADGRLIAFDSIASNLVSGDTNASLDIFVRDRYGGTTERVSMASDGTQGDGGSWGPDISGDGRYVAFDAAASNLVPGDTNESSDVFVRKGTWPVFPDVPTDHWASDEIEACFDASIIGGYPDGLYHADIPVSRDQMAVYISRALAGGDDHVPEFTETPTFPDVPEGYWALDYVEYAFEQNVVAGYGDGTYRPEYEVTRDQMAVYVARALVAPSGEAGLADYVPADPLNFPDVPDTGYGDDGTEPFWAYRHIEYCVEQGVVQGYLDGYYHPEDVVTRDQMAVYMARAFL